MRSNGWQAILKLNRSDAAKSHTFMTSPKD